MVKQDAMNVFLGFYIPNEMLVPLWDLDSDYHLHNRISRPPTPYIDRILYEQRHATATATATASSSSASSNIQGATSESLQSIEEGEGEENVSGEIEGGRVEVKSSRQKRIRDQADRQAMIAKKYFVNTRAVLLAKEGSDSGSGDEGVPHSRGRGGIPLWKIDSTRLFQEEDQETPSTPPPVYSTPPSNSQDIIANEIGKMETGEFDLSPLQLPIRNGKFPLTVKLSPQPSLLISPLPLTLFLTYSLTCHFCSPLFQFFFWGLEHLMILEAIDRSEQRKVRVRAVGRRIEEASQMWWKEVFAVFVLFNIFK